MPCEYLTTSVERKMPLDFLEGRGVLRRPDLEVPGFANFAIGEGSLNWMEKLRAVSKLNQAVAPGGTSSQDLSRARSESTPGRAACFGRS